MTHESHLSIHEKHEKSQKSIEKNCVFEISFTFLNKKKVKLDYSMTDAVIVVFDN